MSTGALVGLIVGGAVLLLIVIALMAKKSAAPVGQRVCGGCKRVMLPVWTKCLFCGWAPGARLEFILGPMANQVLQLAEDVTTIGSVAGATVVLADPAVSRKHAAIRKVDGGFELADLGSTNGVYVNGHKVPKKTLEPGDIVRVGNTEAVFKRG
ncbi:MAG: FHA domain-containing protein [Myxococcales bacterium]|nr:FHA domain-containing protein [Myxococcales bacterium]